MRERGAESHTGRMATVFGQSALSPDLSVAVVRRTLIAMPAHHGDGRCREVFHVPAKCRAAGWTRSGLRATGSDRSGTAYLDTPAGPKPSRKRMLAVLWSRSSAAGPSPAS